MIRLIFRLLLVGLLIVSLLLGLVCCAAGAVLGGGADAVQSRLARVQRLIFRFRDWWFAVRGQLFPGW